MRTTIRRKALRAMLVRMGVTTPLPRFGRQLIVAAPGGAVLRIDRAFDNGGKARPTDTFVMRVEESVS